MALELVPASKGLLDNGISQGNTELLRTWTVPSKRIPNQVIIDRCGLVYHASRTEWADYEVWAQFWSLRMFGPRPNEPEIIPRTNVNFDKFTIEFYIYIYTYIYFLISFMLAKLQENQRSIVMLSIKCLNIEFYASNNK